MHTDNVIDHRQLYRLPWTLPDNAISWLEPTSACNLACDGCYRENVTNSHKSLDAVRDEVETFVRLRNADGISIAGGDPLLHPQIVEIVRMIAEKGVKPVVNTNGATLTVELLRELKKAGVYGFTFHIDSKQGRPKWKNKNEVEMNELRLQFAEMLAEVGGISCAFNSTVYEDTLHETPDLVDWAAKHIDIVHVMVFILYRAAVPQLPFDWYVDGKKVDMNALVYSETVRRKVDLKSTDVVVEIRKRFPEFTPCAYLNGTEKADYFKWLLTGRVGTNGKIYGYVGPKFMEVMQTMHHLGTGKYLAYEEPALTKKGRAMMILSPLDRGIRKAAGRYLSSVLHNPIRLFEGLHYQSVMIIQPIDFLENGYQNMCDGCPDMTLWNGELVWSCRLEELKHFGCWARTVPRSTI
ncbi:MAG: radical SAM protein [Bacteroidota bacterium]